MTDPVKSPPLSLTGTRLWHDQKYPPIDPIKYPRAALAGTIITAVRRLFRLDDRQKSS